MSYAENNSVLFCRLVSFIAGSCAAHCSGTGAMRYLLLLLAKLGGAGLFSFCLYILFIIIVLCVGLGSNMGYMDKRKQAEVAPTSTNNHITVIIPGHIFIYKKMS